MATMSRRAYAQLYGPTVGDGLRLADTSLVAVVEHAHTVYGAECLHGGGKTLRDGIGLASGVTSAAGALDMLLCNVVLIDPVLGIVKGDLGLRGALFADAGTLFGYEGKTNFTPGGGACIPSGVAPAYTQGTCVTVRDSADIRSSVGASVLWASPLGPLRFDYAYATTKDKYDVTQAFRFSGGTSF